MTTNAKCKSVLSRSWLRSIGRVLSGQQHQKIEWNRTGVPLAALCIVEILLQLTLEQLRRHMEGGIQTSWPKSPDPRVRCPYGIKIYRFFLTHWRCIKICEKVMGSSTKCRMIVPNRTERSQIQYSHRLYNFAKSRGHSEMSGIGWYCKSSVKQARDRCP